MNRTILKFLLRNDDKIIISYASDAGDPLTFKIKRGGKEVTTQSGNHAQVKSWVQVAAEVADEERLNIIIEAPHWVFL